MIRLLRGNRDLRWLFIAQIISFTGDWFSFVALAGLVKEATDSGLLVSLAYVSFTLPSFLASPIAGPVVDRYDRRRLLVVISGLQAVAALGLLTASLDRVWPLFIFQASISSLAAFVKPCIDAGVPNLARDDHELRAATALFGSTWGVMLAVGAAAGGVFSEAFGRTASFLANSASFVIALALFALIRRPMQERAHGHRSRVRPIDDMKEMARYAREDHVILALLASKSTFAIGAGTVSQLPVLATEVFGWGDGGTGLLMAARGIGAGLGPIVASRFTKGRLSRVLRVCGVAGLSFSGLYLGAVWMPTLALAFVVISIAHLGGGAQWTLSTYGLQVRSNDALRGRVMAGDFAVATLMMTVSGLGAGLLSQALGVQWAMSIVAVMAGLASITYLTTTRALARSLP